MPLKLFGPKNIFDGQAIAGVTSYTSLAIDTLCMDTASMEIQWTGTCVGNLAVQVSNAGSVWYSTNQAVVDPTGSGGPTDNSFLDLSRISARYIRLSYSNTAGAGTLTVTAIAKGLGG